MGEWCIRKATLDDARQILEIYAPYIEETTITFECEVPSLEAFIDRMQQIMERYPYFVCEEEGNVVGYAYASSYSQREAYNWSADLSVYIKKGKKRQGYGKALYEVLIKELEKMKMQVLYAVVTEENKKSIAFHEKLGFQVFAVYGKVGYKQGKWLDVTWLEKHIGSHDAVPDPVIWYPDIMYSRNL